MSELNVENIRSLAALIREQPDSNDSHDKNGFYMNTEFHTCGTPACIAGWNAWEYDGRPSPEEQNIRYDYMMEAARERLGVTGHMADQLFYMHDTDHSFSAVTAEIAAKVLENLADTGEVNWDAAFGYSAFEDE